MKTMEDYTQYCTEEQTRRAYELGAPIESKTKAGYYCNKEYPIQLNVFQYGKVPTTQQMIRWLREQGIRFYFNEYADGVYYQANSLNVFGFISNNVNTYKEAELAAIDAALDYLEQKGE